MGFIANLVQDVLEVLYAGMVFVTTPLVWFFQSSNETSAKVERE